LQVTELKLVVDESLELFHHLVESVALKFAVDRVAFRERVEFSVIDAAKLPLKCCFVVLLVPV